MSDSKPTKPDYVVNLEAIYGPPGQTGFGSAVFHEQLQQGEDLEQVAQRVYRHFVGELWERWGEETWMGPWREVYSRPPGSSPGSIVAELHGIDEPMAAGSVPLVVEVGESPDRTHAALSAAYDDAAVTDLRVFTIGDGDAMSGLLVAGQRASATHATLLVALMD